MKISLALVSLFLAASAQAANPCEQYLGCGIYQNVAKENGQKVVMNLVLAPEGSDHARMILQRSSPAQSGWINVRLDFSADGSFVGFRPQETRYMEGSCQKNFCNFVRVGQMEPGIDKASGSIAFKKGSIIYRQVLETSQGTFETEEIYSKIK